MEETKPHTAPPATSPEQRAPRLDRYEYGVVIAGVLCAVFLWFFGARPFLVDGASMYPTFNASPGGGAANTLISGDYLIIDLFSYLFLREPDRFDVVVFRSPIEPRRYLLKRIIGLPNEQVALSGATVTVTTAAGAVLVPDEPYINPEEPVTYADQTVQLGDDQYFLLGDNRTNSLDSRVWGGLVKDNIIGRVIVRLYPFEAAAVNPGVHAAGR